MKSRLLLLPLSLSVLLGACSMTEPVYESQLTAFEGNSVEQIREAFGEPNSTSTLSDGHQLDVFLFVSKGAVRSGFRSMNNQIQTYPNDSQSMLVGHNMYAANTPRLVDKVSCKVEALYNAEGVVKSMSEKPLGCVTVSQES
ncbi:hypothetical protein BK026_09125 [Alteromonas sp. V450]|uniref:hypothetical protein n=1 Tax=Alteromonas sp. V450 TaxID=1912139 RepID=UPI0008FF0C5E|nr:hypothetical protein [Alteromonas sp. V450]OJF68941.1 hypothetical protein BK026_09125 [Alteromonas sp. V450]